MTKTQIAGAGLFAAVVYAAAGAAYYKKTGRQVIPIDILKWPLTLWKDRKQNSANGSSLKDASMSALAGTRAGVAVPR